MKLTAIVIEDEFKLREMFIQLLQTHCPEIDVIGDTGNITEGYNLIVSKKPDVIFLDIEMPQGNGFDLLSKFETIPFEVIFVSSYEQYAIRALKLSALDFILKPVVIEELLTLTDKIKSAIELKESAGKYRILKENLKSPDTEKQIMLNSRDRMESVKLGSIVYLKADLNYTHFFLSDKRRIVVSKTLKDFEEMLCEVSDSLFVRIHKSFIINVSFIKSIERGESSMVILKDDTTLEVSRRKKMALIEHFNTKKK